MGACRTRQVLMIQKSKASALRILRIPRRMREASLVPTTLTSFGIYDMERGSGSDGEVEKRKSVFEDPGLVFE